MKCDLCREEIEKTFLEKINGTYIKIDGKRKVICKNCQRKYKNKLKEEF